jgi:hypothetical protein
MRLLPRRPGNVMRTDDPVIPGGGSRVAAARVTAVAILLVVFSAAALLWLLSDRAREADDRATQAAAQASLSADEVTALRDLLNSRTQRRDDEVNTVQAQLDEQRRILCVMITDVLQVASQKTSPALERATVQLDCASLLGGR